MDRVFAIPYRFCGVSNLTHNDNRPTVDLGADVTKIVIILSLVLHTRRPTSSLDKMSIRLY